MIKSIFSKKYQFMLRKLKKARLEAGLTQNAVAKKLGKTQSYVSKCESGERRLDVIELNKFAKIYKKNINYFLNKLN